MAEDLHVLAAGSKAEKYKNLLPQLKELLRNDDDEISCMANLCAALKTQFNWLWVGFYRVQGSQLVLGPFQGPVACSRITKGRGVCGTAWAQGHSIIVPDVNTFPGHIACSSQAISEIVIPYGCKQIMGVLDVDSEAPGAFDKVDEEYLKEILTLLPGNVNGE